VADVVNESLWARFLLVRLLTYSAGSSVLVTSLKGYYLWNWPQIYFVSTELKLQELAGTASSVFLTVFILGGAILGTIHSIIALIKYRQFTSSRDNDVS
jgi:hypothetical protein